MKPISIRGGRLPSLAETLKGRGVAIRFGVDWHPADADADIVVDCRGLAARDALPDLRGVRGEMIVVRSPDVSLSRPVRMLHPRMPLYIVPRGDGRVHDRRHHDRKRAPRAASACAPPSSF